MVFVWRDYCFASEDLTGMHWVLSNKLAIPGVVHVLDDFLFIRATATQECMHSLHSFLILCENINIPIKHTKTVYPSTVMFRGNRFGLYTNGVTSTS